MYFLRRIMLVMVGIVFFLGTVKAEEAVGTAVEEVPVEEEVQAAAPAETPAAEEAAPAEESAVAESVQVPAEAPAAEPAPAPAESAATTEGGDYAVVKGDTLWDLAARYYQDPYKWGRIWDANRDAIRNPNLIYPDQNFRIPGADVESAPAAEAPAEEPAEAPAEEAAAPAETPAEAAPVEEAAAPSEEAVEEAPARETVAEAPAEAAVVEEAAPVESVDEAPEPVAPPAVPKKKPSRYVATDVGNDNFIVDENWEADGYVLRDEFRKLLIAQDDVIYLNIGASNGARPYMRGGIYRQGGKVKDPDTRKRLGYIMRRIGTFQLTENVGDGSSSAVITSSREPIRIGDIVRLENN